MPMRLLLIVAASAALIVFEHSMPVYIGTGAAIFLAASLIVLTRLAPDAARLASPPPPPPGWIGGGRLLDEAGNERVSRLTAYWLTLVVGGAGLLLALWKPGVAFAILAITAIWIVAWWPSALRTSSLTTSIVIKRQPADVFAFVSDQRNLLSYWPFYESMEMVTPDPVGRGSQFKSRVRLPKSLFNSKEDDLFEAVDEIVGFEPPHRLALRVSSGLRPNIAVFTFDAIDGGTRLTHHFTMELSYSASVLGGVLLGGKGIQRTTRTIGWARAKEILERETP